MPKTLHRPESDLLRQMLLAARHEAGLTQADVAGAWGVPQERISAIERGIRRLDLIELQDLCALMGVDLLDFVGEFHARSKVVAPRRTRPIASGIPRHRR
ncbi:MAG: helix-turn-helix transcriptional regulator [Pseudoxanthomonas suwonensis]|nr:helix-turn-helix transcriptional regulator [Pseudoxanthomonas suwonensis]